MLDVAAMQPQWCSLICRHLGGHGLLMLVRRQLEVDSSQFVLKLLANSDEVNPTITAYLALLTAMSDSSTSYQLH